MQKASRKMLVKWTTDVLQGRLRSTRDQRAAHLQRPIVGRDQTKVELSGLKNELENIS